MSYRELEIYRESKRLAIDVHRMTLELPKFELYGQGQQVRRSSKSITALIVEGYGRLRYLGDYVKYLVYAQAECDETIVHLEFLKETGAMKDDEVVDRLKSEYEILSKRINRYIQVIERR